MADVWDDILGTDNPWNKLGFENVDRSGRTILDPKPVMGPTIQESLDYQKELAAKEAKAKEVELQSSSVVPDDIRQGVRFNAAIPTHMMAVGYTKEASRKNRVGAIMRDFNMRERLTAINGWTRAEENWGFRFHYNPSSVQEVFSPPMGMDYVGFIMDIADNPLLLVSTQTGAQVNFEVLLLRRADMVVLNQPDWASQYPEWGRPSVEDREEILNKGTQYDIEHFFRVVNLDPVLTWRNERTSDWGMMMATPLIISLGDSDGCRMYRGQVQSLSVQHRMYAPGMIPVYSSLSFSIIRIPDMYGAEGYGNISSGPEYGYSSPSGDKTGNEATDLGPTDIPVTGSTQHKNQSIARPMLAEYGWDSVQWRALQILWQRESNWDHLAKNKSSGAYGIPQSLPGDKMASAGSDWRTNPTTQIKWGLKYIKDRYGDPVKALQHHDRKNWY